MKPLNFRLLVLLFFCPTVFALDIRIGWDARQSETLKRHIFIFSTELTRDSKAPLKPVHRPLHFGVTEESATSLLEEIHRRRIDLAIVPMHQLPTINMVALGYASFGMATGESGELFQSTFAQAGLERLSELGYAGLALWNGPPTYLASKTPLLDPRSFEGKRITTFSKDALPGVLSALGAKTIHSDLFSGTPVHLADAAEVRLDNLKGFVAASQPQTTYLSAGVNTGFALVASSVFLKGLSVADRGNLELAISATTEIVQKIALEDQRRLLEQELNESPSVVYVGTAPEVQRVALTRASELGGSRVWKGAIPQLPKSLQPVPILYVTNRQAIERDGTIEGYSGERRDDDMQSHGVAVVGVHRNAKFAGYGSWFNKTYFVLERLVKAEVADVVRVLRGGPFARPQFQQRIESEFFSDLSRTLAEMPKKERMALVFIHGYNTAFDDALIMAAQLSIDLKIPGVTVLFSWPSVGSIEGYAADAASVAASEYELARLIDKLQEQDGVDSIVMIAHSMGSRALLRALREVAVPSSGRIAKLQHVIFAAPDEDITVFRRHANALIRRAGRTTLYTSQKDRALLLSKGIHNFPRAGLHPPLMIVPNLDTIAVNDADKSLAGHGYVVDNEAVMYDMHALIHTGETPEKRPRINRKVEKGHPYYIFRE